MLAVLRYFQVNGVVTLETSERRVMQVHIHEKRIVLLKMESRWRDIGINKNHGRGWGDAENTIKAILETLRRCMSGNT
jgi:hypothetical protein